MAAQEEDFKAPASYQNSGGMPGLHLCFSDLQGLHSLICKMTCHSLPTIQMIPFSLDTSWYTCVRQLRLISQVKRTKDPRPNLPPPLGPKNSKLHGIFPYDEDSPNSLYAWPASLSTSSVTMLVLTFRLFSRVVSSDSVAVVRILRACRGFRRIDGNTYRSAFGSAAVLYLPMRMLRDGKHWLEDVSVHCESTNSVDAYSTNEADAYLGDSVATLESQSNSCSSL